VTDPSIYFEPEPGVYVPRAGAVRVLIIDDDRDTVRTLLAIMRLHGMDARGVTKGQHALAAFRDFNPDAIIVDISLHGTNGWQVARDIRAEPVGKRPLLIGVSGRYKQSGDKIVSELAGFDHYLIKPCDPSVLLVLLEKAESNRVAEAGQVVQFPGRK
jgi:DNA-binding response OmpR family regulator